RRTVSSERQRELRHRTLDTHTQIFNLRADNLLHERDKLIATGTREKVVLTQLPRDQVRHLAQHLVACFVPVSIVDVLKLIEVEHHDLERSISATRTRGLFFKSQRQVT